MDPATLLALVPLAGGVISALVALGTGIHNTVVARRAANNTPAMQDNAQAKTDEKLDEQAEAAITAADNGKPLAEQEGDAR